MKIVLSLSKSIMETLANFITREGILDEIRCTVKDYLDLECPSVPPTRDSIRRPLLCDVGTIGHAVTLVGQY